MMEKQRIVILGGTGLIGAQLKTTFETLGNQVSCFGRQALGDDFDLAGQLNGIDLLINLMGANIGQRWHKGYQTQLWNSRVEATKHVAKVIEGLEQPPKRVIAASAIGYYPQSDCQHPYDEYADPTPNGQHFLSDLSIAWEAASQTLVNNPEDLIIFRFGVVLSTKGGALAKMLPAFKFGLGGPVAGGQQCFSWIHIEDLARGFLFAIDTPEMHGVYNLTAPQPLTQKAFGKTLANTLHRPFLIPLPAWQLKLMFGKGAQVLTHSSAVLPTKLTEMDFEFNFPDAESALDDIILGEK